MPVVFHNASETTSGTTSVLWSQVATGLWSQWYMRLRHPAWFGKYNYIAGGGLDAGSKVMMLILTFAVAGGSGRTVPFPKGSLMCWSIGILYKENLHLQYLGSGGETRSQALRNMPTIVEPVRRRSNLKRGRPLTYHHMVHPDSELTIIQSCSYERRPCVLYRNAV